MSLWEGTILTHTAKRILLWLYQRQQQAADDSTPRWPLTSICTELAISTNDGKTAIGSVFGKYVTAVRGDNTYSMIHLTPEGYTWAEMEVRKARLASNVLHEAIHRAEVKRNNTLEELTRTFGAQPMGVYDRRTLVLGRQKAEYEFIQDVVDSHADRVAAAVTLESDDQVLHATLSSIAEAINLANDRLKALQGLELLTVPELLQQAERRVAIALDKKALGQPHQSEHTIIRNQTTINTGSHSQVIGTAEKAVQVQANSYGGAEGLEELIKEALGKLDQLGLNDTDRKASEEALTDMQEEVTKPTPRRGFLKWCADQFPAAVRTIADFAKIIDVVVKLTGGTTPPHP